MLSLVASIGSFIPGLFGKELTLKTAKAAGIVILAAVLIAGLTIARIAYDASVVNRAEVKHEAAVATKTLQADRAADEALENKAAAFDEVSAKLDLATAEAERADPVAAKTTVGPVTSSYYAELRKKEKRK
jgi:hypothetical protein